MIYPVRTYEAMVIASPELSEEALSQLQKSLGEVIAHQGGRVLDGSVLGKRRLSFSISRFSEGTYLQIRFELSSNKVGEVKKAVAMMESIIRMMVIQGSSLSGSPSLGPSRFGAHSRTVDRETRREVARSES